MERDELYRQGYQLLRANEPYVAIEFFKKRADKYALYQLGDFPSHLVHFKNVTLYNDHWILIDKDKIYSRELAGRRINEIPVIKNRISGDGRYIILNLEEAKENITVSEECVFLGGDENYCHWILRYLMRLSLLEEYPELKKRRLLINSNLFSYQKESLEMWGIKENQLIEVPFRALIHCENIHVPTNLRIGPFFEYGVHLMRKKFLRNLKGKKRLYLSREKTDRRQITNENEVLTLLVQHGFEIVIPGKMSFGEQVKVFSEAAIVVGAHGAGLTNMLFAPQGAILIELSDELLSYMPDFRMIAAAVPLIHFELVSKEVKTYPGKNPLDDHDFTVNMEELEICLLKSLKLLAERL